MALPVSDPRYAITCEGIPGWGCRAARERDVTAVVQQVQPF